MTPGYKILCGLEIAFFIFGMVAYFCGDRNPHALAIAGIGMGIMAACYASGTVD